MKAAGDKTRMAILYMLLREPLTLPIIRHRLLLSPPLAAHHLQVLRRAGWVTKSKYGKLVTFMIAPQAVHEVTAFFKKLSL